MPGITLQNGLISYYGNPAGYMDKETAVVDSIFRGETLSGWLEARALTPQWTDGVMERLLAGEQPGSIAPIVLLKNVRIWQLKPDVDVRMKFIPYEDLLRRFGEPDPDDYRVAYDGQLNTNDLEAIYTRCNAHPPPGYDGHLLSMSDVVELYDSSGSAFHYCDRGGFREIRFEFQTQAPFQGMSMRL